MSRVVTREEDAIIAEAERLGLDGKNLSEIAAIMGRPYHGLRAMLEKHGLEAPSAGVIIRAKIGGARYSELRQAGAIVVADEADAPALSGAA